MKLKTLRSFDRLLAMWEGNRSIPVEEQQVIRELRWNVLEEIRTMTTKPAPVIDVSGTVEKV